jgi:hypothetical protein
VYRSWYVLCFLLAVASFPCLLAVGSFRFLLTTRSFHLHLVPLRDIYCWCLTLPILEYSFRQVVCGVPSFMKQSLMPGLSYFICGFWNYATLVRESCSTFIVFILVTFMFLWGVLIYMCMCMEVYGGAVSFLKRSSVYFFKVPKLFCFLF